MECTLRDRYYLRKRPVARRKQDSLFSFQAKTSSSNNVAQTALCLLFPSKRSWGYNTTPIILADQALVQGSFRVRTSEYLITGNAVIARCCGVKLEVNSPCRQLIATNNEDCSALMFAGVSNSTRKYQCKQLLAR